MAKRDHKVEVTTRNGDELVRRVTEKEARELENEPFNDGSNVAAVKVTKEDR